MRDAGRAGVPCIGYNFSIAGVWGWPRGPFARGEAMSVGFDLSAIDPDRRCRTAWCGTCATGAGSPGAAPLTVGERRTVGAAGPFPERAGAGRRGSRRGACRPSRRPPAEALRGAARLVNRPAKYDRLLDLVDLPANALELCLGSLQEMPGGDDLRGRSPLRPARADRLHPFPQRARQGAALSRDVRRRGRHRHGRDRPHPARRGLRGVLDPRPYPGDELPGAVACRAWHSRSATCAPWSRTPPPSARPGPRRGRSLRNSGRRGQ